MLLCLALLLALWSAACGETVSLPESLGVNASQGTVQDHWDDHGGFHGDGTAYWEIAFSPEEAAALEKSLQGAQGWQPLPVDGDAQALLYGAERQGHYSGPYLTGQDGEALLPPVEEGYWFFYNKQTDSYTAQGPWSGRPKLHRRCLRQPEPHPLLRGIGHIKSTKNRNGRK